nr:MAG TPA: hypothetical protein [Caudoviricetes sp.]
MEELEKNETSAHAEENTVSLASAQALADALAKIEVYTPTTWVDNSSPDIDAEHLNKPEQAIKRVTDALNSAVDVIKDLQSQVTKNAGDISTVNNNLSNQTDRVTQLYSDKADKSEFTWKTLGTVSNNEVLNISNITKTANEICIVVYFLIDKNERDYFYIIPVAGLGDGGSVITIGGYYAAAGDYGVVQVNASTSGIGLVTVYHGGQDVRSKASLKVRYR